MEELKKERIALEVIKTLKSRFDNFPEDSSDNRNAPFHKAFLEAFKLKLEQNVNNIPIFVSLASWMHGLNTTLGQSFFEKTAQILCDGEKREFNDLLINSSQQEKINEIITALKNKDQLPNLILENNSLLTEDHENIIRIPNFTADVYFEDEDKIVAIELKTVKPNSGVFKGEKEKILYAKAALKNKYPNKEIYYYLGFPFDPLSEESCGFDKNRFFNYGIDFKKFFDPNEVLLADELWNFLSEESQTMNLLLDIINSISKPDFMDKFTFVNNSSNFKIFPDRYTNILSDWFLKREHTIIQKFDSIQKAANNKKRVSRILNQTLFNDKGEYRENRVNALLVLINS